MTRTLSSKRLIGPWEGDKGVAPFELRTWYGNPTRGILDLVQESWELEEDPVTRQMVPVSKGKLTRLDGFYPLFNLEQVKRIFTISATKEIPIIEAMIEVYGKNRFPPEWLEEAEYAVGYIADKKYAEDAKVEGPPSRRKLKKA